MKEQLKFLNLIREIKNKKQNITLKLIGTYVEKRYHPDGMIKTGEMIGQVEKRIDKQFDARKMFQQEDGEKTLQEHSQFLDEILSCKQSRQNYIYNSFYILCTYDAGGYNKRALFYEGLNEVYAVNGTAKAFTKYNDVNTYDPAKDGSVNIPEVLSKF